jgi:hypothetical protein
VRSAGFSSAFIVVSLLWLVGENRLTGWRPQPAAAEPQLALSLQPAETGDGKVVTSLSESHADMLRAALRDLGDARKILDPALPR